MEPENLKAETLSKYRLEKAREMLRDAHTLYDVGSYKSCNNRAYYSIYHALRAIIALDEVEFKRHSGNIQYFLKTYVKTGVFTVRSSDIILSASLIRNSSDYDDFYIASKEETAEQLKNADWFINEVESYLSERYTK